MSALTVIVLVAGGERDDDLRQSRSLIEGDGTSWIEQICAPTEFADMVIIVVQAKVAKRTMIDNAISNLRPDADIVLSPGPTAGTSCSALLTVDRVDPECELLLLNDGEFLDIDVTEVVESFRARGLDVGTIVFPSLHRRFYYASTNARDLVDEVSEKKPTSHNAIANFFWWKRAGDFFDCAMSAIRTQSHMKGRFDICPVLNEMITLGKQVGLLRIDSTAYHPISTEIDSRAVQGGSTT